MNTETFSVLFLVVLLTNVAVKLWLARRQLRHVAAHRGEVPAAFREQIGIAAHHKAADYTSTLARFGMLGVLFDALLLLAFTLGGGIQWLHETTANAISNPLLQGAALIAAVLLLQSLLEMPFDLYRTFNIEARYGFNKMTLRLYCLDALKSLLLGVAIGLPLLLGVLWLMAQMGDTWWLYVWGVWVLFNLLLLYLYPTFIAPLFNTFEPLKDEAQKAQIEALLARCGFAASGLFVMDGSKRSAHGNAYFTGFGKTKRIVFFDTLLQRLAPPEIDAVLAHELGISNAAMCCNASRSPSPSASASSGCSRNGSMRRGSIRGSACKRKARRWRCCCSSWRCRCSPSCCIRSPPPGRANTSSRPTTTRHSRPTPTTSSPRWSNCTRHGKFVLPLKSSQAVAS